MNTLAYADNEESSVFLKSNIEKISRLVVHFKVEPGRRDSNKAWKGEEDAEESSRA